LRSIVGGIDTHVNLKDAAMVVGIAEQQEKESGLLSFSKSLFFVRNGGFLELAVNYFVQP
jgi:hypothetical protein